MATLTSPDSVFTAVVVAQNPEPDGSYVIAVTQAGPAGQHYAVEVNGVRVYEENANGGTGTEG